METIKRYLKKNYGEGEIFTADNAFAAMDVLTDNQPFDYLFLDHDLGAEEGNNGVEVVNFIIKNKIRFDHCYIHSMNYAGGNEMYQLLNDNDNSVSKLSMMALI
jgi:hypothetical protein